MNLVMEMKKEVGIFERKWKSFIIRNTHKYKLMDNKTLFSTKVIKEISMKEFEKFLNEVAQNVKGSMVDFEDRKNTNNVYYLDNLKKLKLSNKKTIDSEISEMKKVHALYQELDFFHPKRESEVIKLYQDQVKSYYTQFMTPKYEKKKLNIKLSSCSPNKKSTFYYQYKDFLSKKNADEN